MQLKMSLRAASIRAIAACSAARSALSCIKPGIFLLGSRFFLFEGGYFLASFGALVCFGGGDGF
jgi:hypothetical protein